MGIIIMLLFGALVGWLASMIMNTDAQMGAVSNIVVGIVGSLLGGLIYTFLTKGDADLTDRFMSFDIKSLIISLVGALALIGMLKFFRKDNML